MRFGGPHVRNDWNSICLVSDDLERSRRIVDVLGWRFPVDSVNLHSGNPVRIMTIVDFFSALIDKHSYKEAMPNEQAYEILLEFGDKLDQDIEGAFELTAAHAIAATDKVLNDAVPV